MPPCPSSPSPHLRSPQTVPGGPLIEGVLATLSTVLRGGVESMDSSMEASGFGTLGMNTLAYPPIGVLIPRRVWVDGLGKTGSLDGPTASSWKRLLTQFTGAITPMVGRGDGQATFLAMVLAGDKALPGLSTLWERRGARAAVTGSRATTG